MAIKSKLNKLIFGNRKLTSAIGRGIGSGRKSKTGLTKEQAKQFFTKANIKGTKRYNKEQLKKQDSQTIKEVVNYASKINPATYLLSKGITARQLKAKGVPIIEVAKIFGIKETIGVFGTHETANAFGGIKLLIKQYGLEKIGPEFGIKEVSIVYGGLDKLLQKLTLKKAVMIFGEDQLLRACGGMNNILEMKGQFEYNLFNEGDLINAFGPDRVYKEIYNNNINKLLSEYDLKNLVDSFGSKFTIKIFRGVENISNKYSLSEISYAFDNHLEQIVIAFGGIDKIIQKYGINKTIETIPKSVFIDFIKEHCEKHKQNPESYLLSKGLTLSKLIKLRAFNPEQLAKLGFSVNKINTIFKRTTK